MSLSQRFTLMVKSNVTAVLDRLEDPERSLHQLILDMEEQLEAAKQAAASAMANEEQLRNEAASMRRSAEQWRQGARRALARNQEDDAREALRRAEEADAQGERLGQRLEQQSVDTREVTDGIFDLQQRLEQARRRLQLLQARMRQRDARQAAGKVLQGARQVNLHYEFDRLEKKVDLQAAEAKAYSTLDGRLRGEDLRRRLDDQALEHSVDEKLEAMRRELES